MARSNRPPTHAGRPVSAAPSGPGDVAAGWTDDHWRAPRDFGAQAAAAGNTGAHDAGQDGGAADRAGRGADPFAPRPYRYDMETPPGVLRDGEQLVGGHTRSFDAEQRRRGPKNYRRSDDRIREDICDELIAAMHLDASDVSVDVADATVTLQGIVPERRMKHAIEDIAAGCRGVREVDNRIRVVRGGADPLLER